MKTTAVLLCLLFLAAALTFVEARRRHQGRGRHHGVGNRMKNHRYADRCSNNTCYQPCEIAERNCSTNHTCVERIKTCHSNASISVTLSRCETKHHSSSCNCTSSQICVRRGKGSTSCRARVLNAQPVTNPVTCPKKTNHGNRNHHHHRGGKGRYGGRGRHHHQGRNRGQQGRGRPQYFG